MNEHHEPHTIRHGARVRLTSLTQRLEECGLEVGMQGKVIALRQAHRKAECLVKWDRKASPVAVYQNQLEEVKK